MSTLFILILCVIVLFLIWSICYKLHESRKPDHKAWIDGDGVCINPRQGTTGSMTRVK